MPSRTPGGRRHWCQSHSTGHARPAEPVSQASGSERRSSQAKKMGRVIMSHAPDPGGGIPRSATIVRTLMMTWPEKGATKLSRAWTLCAAELSFLALWPVGKEPFRCSIGTDHTRTTAGSPEMGPSWRAGAASVGPLSTQNPVQRSSAEPGITCRHCNSSPRVSVLLAVKNLHGDG